MRNPATASRSPRSALLALRATFLGLLLVAVFVAAGAGAAAGAQASRAAAHPRGVAHVSPRHGLFGRHHRSRPVRQPVPVTGTETPSPAPAPTETPTRTTPAPAPSPAPAPAPSPVPSPSPSSDLLFKGTKIRDYSLNQSAPGAVTEVPDPAGSGSSVFEMTVANSDVYPVTPTADPRAQLLSPSIIEPGDEFWWSGKFFLPGDFPASVPGWLTVMEGPYGAPFNGTPPWHIEVNGSSLRWQRNGTYNWDIPWQVPLIRNSWVDVVVHERFGSDGWVEMWVDGQPITFFGAGTYNPRHEAPTTHLAMATRDGSNDEGANFTVIQSYRKAGMFDNVSLFQGPMAIGKTRAAVE